MPASQRELWVQAVASRCSGCSSGSIVRLYAAAATRATGKQVQDAAQSLIRIAFAAAQHASVCSFGMPCYLFKIMIF
jgi:hypothetical protein